MTAIPSQLRDAIIRVGPNTVILPAGVGDSELTELRSSRETVERLSVSAADLPRLRGQLPEGLERLNVRGPEVTKPRWPGRYEDDGLSVSLQGVAADTISHLAALGRTVTRLEIYDCSDLTTGNLEPLTRCPKLQYLNLSGGVPDAVSLEPLTRCRELRYLTLSGGVPDTVSLEPLTRCPELRYLTLSGGVPDTVSLKPLTRCRELRYLTLSGGVPDTVSLEPLTRCPKLSDLTLSGGVPDTVSLEPLTRCPELYSLTLSGGVPDTVSLEPLTRCPKLSDLTLSGGVPDTVSLEPLTRCPGLYRLTLSGGVPDAVLDSLSGCPGVQILILGDRQRPAETAFTAAAYTRLVKSCRKLWCLYLHCTADTGRAVLTALKEADLRYSNGWPRTICLRVPVELYRQLERQGGGRVEVCKWGK
ncbi:LRR receptor-like serine/threonine-protein kinase HSL2 [Amphibalanus amphitrite]|uniref:LRR receptor-like serine/threonine-protein kinase HSL2 n=1 Tax=Amphibalanus amphitrite TaxID=1232801 RepID=UPI001C9147FB|nr:LRR receptor-like serine/threonine-protein kinase HSL2 [Amphibalanus amphitrite]